MKNRILVISEKLQVYLDFLLSVENVSDIYYVESIHDGFYQLIMKQYQLVILTEIENIKNVCKIIETIRKIKKIPILILTAKTVEERAVYIKEGADEVLNINSKEDRMKLEVFALIRRYSEWEMSNNGEKQNVIQNGMFSINFEFRKIYWKEQELYFTKHEFDFLYLLMATPERVYSFNQIYQIVWGDYPRGNIANMIWCMVKRIKKKLKAMDPDMPDVLHNERDIGYYFKLDVDI